MTRRASNLTALYEGTTFTSKFWHLCVVAESGNQQDVVARQMLLFSAPSHLCSLEKLLKQIILQMSMMLDHNLKLVSRVLLFENASKSTHKPTHGTGSQSLQITIIWTVMSCSKPVNIHFKSHNIHYHNVYLI